MTVGQRSILRVLTVMAAVGGGFVLLEAPFRRFEILVCFHALRALGAHSVAATAGATMLITPRSGAFWIVLTPSCSSLSAILAVLALALCLRPASGRRWYVGSAVAVAVVFVGNIIRIDSSVAIGLVAGRAALVLFHDWVGSIFGFASVLGAWVLLLWLQLPRHNVPAATAGPAAGVLSSATTVPAAELVTVHDGAARWSGAGPALGASQP